MSEDHSGKNSDTWNQSKGSFNDRFSDQHWVNQRKSDEKQLYRMYFALGFVCQDRNACRQNSGLKNKPCLCFVVCLLFVSSGNSKRMHLNVSGKSTWWHLSSQLKSEATSHHDPVNHWRFLLPQTHRLRWKVKVIQSAESESIRVRPGIRNRIRVGAGNTLTSPVLHTCNQPVKSPTHLDPIKPIKPLYRINQTDWSAEKIKQITSRWISFQTETLKWFSFSFWNVKICSFSLFFNWW